MRWFRMYEEVLDDPKVQKLPPKYFKLWVNVLCTASKNSGIIPQIEDLSFALHTSNDRAKRWLQYLIDRGLIDEESGVCTPHNWNGRQFVSDDISERVKRYRERSKPVTRNDTVTPSDTDTEQIQKETPIVPLQGTGVSGKWSPERCAEFLKSIGWKSWSQLEPEQAEAIRAIPWKDLDQQESAPGSLPMLHTRLLLFDGIWSRYWRKDDKMTGLKAFMKHVKTDDAVADVDAAIEAQAPEMLARPKDKRPLLATWINKFRWKTDKADAALAVGQGGEWNLN